MIFTTYWFVLFAMITLPVFWLLHWRWPRLIFLLGACVVFHGHFAGVAGVMPIVVLGLLAYFVALSRRRGACAMGMWVCVLALCFYKYMPFICESVIGSINKGLGERALAAAKVWMPAAPPLGISFFVFEFVHYLYEVRRGREPIRSPFDFSLFSIFFPSLVAGPIKRYQEFLPALHAGIQRVAVSDVAQGLLRVCVGYFKKVCVADNLTAWINHSVPQFATLPMLERWEVLAGIALRILFDFSGYSDIAIGLAQMMGIRLPENFNWPYVATNIQEFWQRWHISLSSWIRDYIYIPLGGSRHGAGRRVLNGLIAFGLCGLWHGPAWNFLLWGLYHGVGLVICSQYRMIPRIGPAVGDMLARARPVAWLITLLFVCFGWLLFFYPVGEALKMAGLLFHF